MAEEEQEVVISYETLYEYLRREKNRDEIQKLPQNFSGDVNEYLEKLRQAIKSKKRQVSSFEGDEIRKEENRLNNLVGLVTDLYQRREKKLISLAITKSRTKAKLADVASLTGEEKEFFNDLVKVMDYYRESILKKMIALGEGEVEKPDLEKADKNTSNVSDEGGNSSVSETREVQEPGAQTSVNKDSAPQKRRVRFLCAVPKFLDNNVNVLGPFEEGDMASLPSSIADILIKKGRAEEINNS
ncbi:MAG: hypothetical protein ACOCQG_03690 [Candidatus Nanoarchaeia archaeon]